MRHASEWWSCHAMWLHIQSTMYICVHVCSYVCTSTYVCVLVLAWVHVIVYVYSDHIFVCTDSICPQTDTALHCGVSQYKESCIVCCSVLQHRYTFTYTCEMTMTHVVTMRMRNTNLLVLDSCQADHRATDFRGRAWSTTIQDTVKKYLACRAFEKSKHNKTGQQKKVPAAQFLRYRKTQRLTKKHMCVRVSIFKWDLSTKIVHILTQNSSWYRYVWWPYIRCYERVSMKCKWMPRYLCCSASAVSPVNSCSNIDKEKTLWVPLVVRIPVPVVRAAQSKTYDEALKKLNPPCTEWIFTKWEFIHLFLPQETAIYLFTAWRSADFFKKTF